ncbi:MAG: hypothetical protein DRQ55_11045 [Planctomycetota bacterium]|nr:MAG: hypothetical protein DRQ55_11045 [Planctomycetota bacterium]
MRLSPSSAGLFIVFASLACAAPQPRPTAERFGEHVAWLADDAREGRQAGSAGFQAASDYVARHLTAAGLVPLGDDGGWLQRFEASGNRELMSDGNRLSLGSLALELERDWMPFASAPSGQVEGALAFAGYGMADPGDDSWQGTWDDYAGLELEGRVVVVLRGGPLPDGHEPGSGRWLAGRGQKHITLFNKINEAYKHGAAGIIIVNAPRDVGQRGDQAILYANSFRGATASLPAVSLTWAAAQRALGPLGLDLEAEQRALDSELAPRSRLLDDARADLAVAAELSTVSTWNLLALLPGAGDVRDGEHVVLGAHLDHLGYGRHGGSMRGAAAVGQIHNGADDNATGSAGLLELARSLSQRKTRPARPIVLAFWGAEEWGLLGSRHYVAQPALPLLDCVAMINMDMIGRSEGGQLEVGGVGTAASLADLLDDALEQLDADLDVVTSPSVPPNSDHQPFFEAHIPVYSLFTGLHDEYHSPDDDTAAINIVAGADIAALGGSLALLLADLDARPVFTDPDAGRATSVAQAKSTKPGRSYSVSFGSYPDMAYSQDDGVRVNRTRAGSPAERCGLLHGDIIIALDGTPIRNMQDYSVLLFSHEPGDEIVITVRRGDETLSFTATLDAPRGGT